jgi:hypothetical protein
MNLQLVIGILSLGFVCYYFMFALCFLLFSLSIVLLSRYLIRFAAPCYSHYSQSHVAHLSIFHLISPTVLPEVPHDLSACYHRVVFVKTRLLPSTTPSGSSSLNHRVVFVKTRFLPSTAPPGATRVVLRTDRLLRPRRAATQDSSVLPPLRL